MANWFQKPLRLPKVPHSFEDMSHNFKTTTKFGLLTPVGIEEVSPSDETKEYRPAAFMRLSPLLYPIMHRVNARMHTFEVPFRILLGEKNYEAWLSDKFEFPEIRVLISEETTEAQYNALPQYDIFTTLGYFKLPWKSSNYDGILYRLPNGLDFLACLVIWREWFADERIDVTASSGIDSFIEDYQDAIASGNSYVTLGYNAVITQLFARMPQDYFTTARPEPQYGDPVNLTGSPTQFTIDPSTTTSRAAIFHPDTDGVSGHLGDNDDSRQLTLDLTIRELWRREQIQRFWDVQNTFGSRTREWLAGHMGVIFPDDRLMIPRLLQTDVHSFNIAEVMQTSASTEDSPLGSYAGKGTLAMRGKSFKRFYVEHGLVITLLSVVPVTGYASGLQRYQYKKSVFDFVIPEFNNIGYQEIYKGELNKKDANPTQPWAYTMRYSEYRSHPNRCSNGFADDQTLLDFHLNRVFDSTPGLNPDFITANQSQFYRIFSDTQADMDSILVDCAIIHKMWRPVSAQPSSMHL